MSLNIQVKFLMRGYKGRDYKALSDEAVLHQVIINLLLQVHVLFDFLMLLCIIRLWLCGVEIGQSTS